jgi:hypothetical protein
VKFIISCERMNQVCRELASRSAYIAMVTGLELPITLLDNFDSVSNIKTPLLNECALYRHSTREILINYSRFAGQTISNQYAILAHEIGHAIAKRDRIMEVNYDYIMLAPYGAEYYADRIACLLGFLEELKSDRRISYGEEYAAILDKWQNEKEFVWALVPWNMKRLMHER